MPHSIDLCNKRFWLLWLRREDLTEILSCVGLTESHLEAFIHAQKTPSHNCSDVRSVVRWRTKFSASGPRKRRRAVSRHDRQREIRVRCCAARGTCEIWKYFGIKFS